MTDLESITLEDVRNYYHHYYRPNNAVLVVVGLVAWIVQLSQGMSVLGVGQIVVWGMYIAAFFTA